MANETYLSPCNVRRDEELHIPMLENPQHNLPKVPLVQVAPTLKQLRRRLLLSRLVLGPCLAPVLARLVVLKLLLLLLLRAPARQETREDEYGFDVKFFKDAKVLFDSLNER